MIIKRHLILIALLFAVTTAKCQQCIDTIFGPDVKTVTLAPLEAPLGDVFDNNGPSFTVSFDVLAPQPELLRYRLLHCNALWQPDNLDAGQFLTGPAEGNINDYQSSFTTLIDYTHYSFTFPEPYTRFSASGNYIVQIFPQSDPDKVLLQRRFCVYEELVDIEMNMTKPTGQYGNIWNHQQVDVEVAPRNGSLPLQESYYLVEIQQNRRDDLRRKLPFSGYSANSMQYRWSAQNVFPAGNHYRYFDLSNLRAAMYHVQRIEQYGGETFAFLQPDEDRSRKAYSSYNSLNGGMKVNIRDRQNPDIEADYVWVNFSLPMLQPFLDGSVHIIGELTQWHFDDNSRMEWNASYKAYTKRMLLKQGYYSYQLLFLPAGESEALTATLEGDHFATPNAYTVRVYYCQPGALFDRLVGVSSQVFGQ